MISTPADTIWPSLRDRLTALMIFRVGLVTVLLGGAVATDIASAPLSDPVNLVLLGLVLLTYLLTLVYALVLDRVEDLRQLAHFQMAADMVIAIALVAVTHGLGSVFLFLLYVVVIDTALVAGRLGALYAAGATSLAMVALGVLTSAGVEHPLLQFERSREMPWPVWFEVGTNCAAAFVIALLAGYLAERLSRLSGALAEKELDLQNLRRLTRQIVKSVDSGILATNRDDRIFFFNRAAAEITGRDRDDVVGEILADLFPEIAERLDAVEDSDDYSYRSECTYTSPQGATKHLALSASTLTNVSGDAIGDILVFQDLTELKALEAEQERSERLAAVGEMAASIAHEIRNPLASISGSVEMIEENPEQADPELFEIVLREVERLDELIADFLEYSDPPSVTVEPTDIGELTEEIVELFVRRGEIEAENVEFAVVEPPVEADVDRESIRQVVWNLVDNARQAVENGRSSDRPSICVRVSRGTRAGRDVVELRVEDAGPGLPEEEVDRIFDPFYTTREGGSGLGLATAQRLVAEHGGTLGTEPPDQLEGAAFAVRLPSSHESRDR